MFRLWGKTFSNNHLVKDSMQWKTHLMIHALTKGNNALREICYEFDLGVPIWLDNNISEFKRIAKTRFYSDSFVESIDFDYLEIQVIEEDM